MPKLASTKTQPDIPHPYLTDKQRSPSPINIKPVVDDPASATPPTSSKFNTSPNSRTGGRPKPKPKNRSNTSTQAWSGPELLAVFHHALKFGPPGSDSAWEGAVPGRTGNSIRLAWRKRVKPMVEAYLLGQGK